MEYRKLPHGEEQISVIGLGNSSLTHEVGEKEIQAAVEMALENGVNYFDMAAGDAAPFTAYGKALAGCREKAYLQVHFGADYHTGKYGWTQDLEQIKRSIAWQLDALRTDYIDFGFIHCVDELSDLGKSCQRRRAGLHPSSQKAGSGSAHRSFLAHARGGTEGNRPSYSRYAHVQHQSWIRLPSRRVRLWASGRAPSPLPPL